jgi:hypothetical protein
MGPDHAVETGDGGLELEDAHSTSSSFREKALEHLFLGELLKELWRRDVHDAEILRVEVDNAGYDLMLEFAGIQRHVQLKASHRAAKTREVPINVNLAGKPSGCVIWIRFDPATLELGPYLWFGGSPREPLPSLGTRVGRHTKANAEGVKTLRPAIRMLPRSSFTELASISDIAVALFGQLGQ